MTCNECEHGQLRRSCEICELRAEAEEQSRLIEKQAATIAELREKWVDAEVRAVRLGTVEGELQRLRQRIESAPVAIMDTRDALGICAPTEEDFPALYALQGKRVRLVVEDGE